MKNINRDYLVTVQARTAKITAPTGMKFFMTDMRTSNIFFLLDFKEYNYNTKDNTIVSLIDKYAYKESADDYTLTLRVVKPNNEPKIIETKRLDKDSNFFYVDLIAEEHTDIPGIYKCELFVDTEILGEDGVLRIERSTSESFTYEVRMSVFYDLSDVVDTKYISIDNIATKDYVDKLAVGSATLDGYATTEELKAKANKEHEHEDYITKAELDETLASNDCANLNLVDFVVSNSISINRIENSVIGDYSTALGDKTASSGYASHAEGYGTIANGDFSHAEGDRTKAANYSSHAEGALTMANQEAAHAEGYKTVAVGYASHAEGYHTKAKGNYQHVQGKYNIDDNTIYAHIVGNGIDSENPSNAHTLDWEGNAWFAGNVFVGSENRVLATESYVRNAIAEAGGNFSGGDDGGNNDCDHVCTPYDDSELRASIEKKADKKIVTDKYERINSLNLDMLDLNNELSGNRRYIRVIDPYDILRIELPASVNIDFAEIHVFISPSSNSTNLSINVDGNPNHVNLKYQDRDMIPEVLEIDIVYEFIFTYINYDNGSGRWLVGAIEYE